MDYHSSNICLLHPVGRGFPRARQPELDRSNLGYSRSRSFRALVPATEWINRRPCTPARQRGVASLQAAGKDLSIPQPTTSNAEVVTVIRDIGDLSLADLGKVIGIVAESLHNQGQVESAVTYFKLNARFPTTMLT